MSKTQITRLLRIAWSSVGKIAEHVVAEHLDAGRLDGLVWLGMDEISHRAEHRFLTCVADHQKGGVVWAAPGRNAATLQGFFDLLTDEQKSSIQAVSIDMSAGYEKAIKESVPDAQVCFDPFHVIQLGGRATDQVRRGEYNEHGRSKTKRGTWIKGARYSLIKDPSNQTVRQLATLAQVQQTNKRLYRAFLLLHELRCLYRVGSHQAP
jgi:transposase